jgi:hypothetical protein
MEEGPAMRSPHGRRPRGGALLASIACLIVGFCAVFVSSASAALPEFNLLGHNGGTNITTMNMTSGVFSGSAIVDGEHFEVQGTETGNESISTLTYITDPSYVSTNTDFYEILPDGNVGGPGSFHDTNGTEESYMGEINEPSATVVSSTSIACTPSATASTCSATVSGAGGTPTGNVTFTASGGSFSGEPACALVAGSCSVTYMPPPISASSTAVTVKAVYSADETYRVSQGSATICGSAGIAVTSVTPESGDADPDGLIPTSKVTLAGKGLCYPLTVQFGNEAARVFAERPDVAADGTSATVVVPRLASTGTLTVTSAGQTATLADPIEVDSFRNTTGLSFPNIYSYQTSVSEFEAAFEPGSLIIQTEGSSPTLTPRAEAIFEHFKPTLLNGLCFGWSLAAMSLASDDGLLTSFDAGASVPWDLSQNSPLTSFIATDMWKQFSEQQVAWERSSGNPQLSQLSRLEAALQPGLDTGGDPPPGILLTLIWESAKGKFSAHEVIAYAREDVGEPGEFKVYVANPEVPFTPGEDATDGQEHSVNTIGSTIQITPKGKGEYTARASFLHQREVGIDAESPSVVSGALTAYTPPNVFGSWFTAGTTLVKLNGASGAPLSVGDGSEGIIPAPTLDENAPATDSFTAPLAAYEETLSGTSGVGDLLETSELTGEVNASAGTDDVSFDPSTDTIGIVPPPAGAAAARYARAANTAHSAAASHTATLTLIAKQPSHGERTLAVTGPAGYTASLAHDRVTVTNTSAHAESVKLTLGNDAGTPQEFVSAAIEIPAAGKLTARPRWTALAGSLTVTIAARGHKAQRRRLANRARPPAATITKLTPNGPKASRSVLVDLHVPALSAGSSVTVTAQVLSGSHVVRTVTREVTLPAKGGPVALTVALGATPSKHARLKVAAITAASGSTITVAQRKRTIALG